MDTIGQTSVYASQWCVLLSFVEATMWHSTEPFTLGVSYWSSGLFAASLILPGLLCVVICPFLPINYASSCLTRCSCAWLSLATRTIPAVVLATSALPLFDNHAATRTILLSVGVVATFIHAMCLFYDSRRYGNTKHQAEITNESRSDEVCSFTSKCGLLLQKRFSKSRNNESIGVPLVVAMFFVMVVRWCFSSVNVFYENWKAASFLLAVVLVYAVVLLCRDVLMHRSEASMYAMKRLSSRNSKEADESVSNSPTYRPNGEAIEEGKPLTGGTQYDSPANIKNMLNGNQAPDVEYQIGNHVDKNANGQKMIINTVTSTPKTEKRNPALPNHIFWLLAIFLGASCGSLAALASWLFTSPTLLCRWGELERTPADNVLVLCFAFGCIAAIFTRSHVFSYSHTNKFDNEGVNRKVRMLKLSRIVQNLSLIFVFLFAAAMILYTKRFPFAIGACLMCLVSPVITRLHFVEMFEMLATGDRYRYGIAPGILMSTGGFCYVVFHVLTIMFINPKLSLVVLGKMDLIVWIETVLIVLPLPICLLRYWSAVRADTPQSSVKKYPTPDCNTSQKNGMNSRKYANLSDARRRHRCVKAAQVLVILGILTAGCLTKHRSAHAECRSSNETCETNSLKGFDLRVASWNLLLGHKMNGRSNLDLVASFLNAQQPHVAAFQEADASPPYWGGSDIFGYLQNAFEDCAETSRGVNPLKSNLGVGIVSRLKIEEEWSTFLPGNKSLKIPNYSVTRVKCQVRFACNISDELGSGNGAEAPRNASSYLYVYSLHAVYKNWTCPRLSTLSRQQMKFVHDDVAALPSQVPVIVMGDFNINPSERELDIWFQSELGFKSALWSDKRGGLSRNTNPRNISCDGDASSDPNCSCDASSSDPPKTTLLNRRAAVDHIFYRGLTLVNASIASDVGSVSDHYPIVADFVF